MSSLRVPVTERDHVQGNADARCVLVEYGDYECPHCRAALPVVQRLERYFGKNLLFVFRNFPLTNIHPFAEPAAETAEFAGAQGRFWEMHERLFVNQDSLGLPLFLELAQDLGLNADELRLSVEQRLHAKRIQKDFTGGVRSGVNGTPTFFINGTRYDGPNDYGPLVEAITYLLR